MRRHRRDFPHGLVAFLLGVVAVLAMLHWRNTTLPHPAPVATQPVVHPAAVLVGATSEHQHRVDSRCLAATASRVSPPLTVHRWIDANGVVHYSDQAPSTPGHRDHSTRIDGDVPPVQIEIVNRGASLPPHVTSKAIAHAVGVGKVMSDVLGLTAADGLVMRVVFAGTEAAWRAEVGPRSPSSTGIYNSARRTMVVRVREDTEATLLTLRHEIVHALVHEWIGSALPPAIEEGLATYFSLFEASGLGGTVNLQLEMPRLQRVARERAASGQGLRELLALGYDHFHGTGRSAHYDVSTALVATLMATPETRSVLGELLRAQRRAGCQPVDARRLLQSGWPGGLSALETAVWRPATSGWRTGVHAY
jgi:hypothetical protein